MNYSLIVISRNRPAFLERLFGYWAKTASRTPILLGDASSSEHACNVTRVVKAFTGRLRLLHTTYDDRRPILARLADQLGKVQTEYVAWVGDDDFTLPQAVESGTRYLDQHADCSAVIGRALLFTAKGDRARGRVLSIGDYLQNPCPESRASDRLLTQARHGTALTYALRRTALMRSIIARVSPDAWPDDPLGYHFFEVIDGFLTAVAGRVVALDRLMMVRQAHAGSTAAVGGRAWSPHRAIVDPRWLDLSGRMIDILSAELTARETQLTFEQARSLSELALCTRVGATLRKSTAAAERQRRGATDPIVIGTKDALKRFAPWLRRSRALAIQRVRLGARDFRRLADVLRAIESTNAARSCGEKTAAEAANA